MHLASTDQDHLTLQEKHLGQSFNENWWELLLLQFMLYFFENYCFSFGGDCETLFTTFEYKSKTIYTNYCLDEMDIETKLDIFGEYFMSLKFLEGLYTPWKAVGKPNHSRSHMLIDGIFSLILIRNRLKVGTWSQGFVLVCRLSCHLSCQSQYGFSKEAILNFNPYLYTKMLSMLFMFFFYFKNIYIHWYYMYLVWF